MILKLLLFAVICTAVYADTLPANDEQTCIKLCNSCQGEASFENGTCECSGYDANEKGADCMKRAKREADDIGMNFVDCEGASGDRSPRCSKLLGASKRLRTSDAARVAKYFMAGGPGSPIVGAVKCATEQVVAAPIPQIQPLQPCASESKAPEPLVAVSNPSSDCVAAPAPQPAAPSVGAYYEVPQAVLGTPLAYPVQEPTLGCPMSTLIPATSNLLNPFNSHKLVNLWNQKNPYNPVHYIMTFLRPIETASVPAAAPPLRPSARLFHNHLLGAPQVQEHIVAVPQAYTPPCQANKERPQMLASPGPIVQPNTQKSVPQGPQVLSLLQQMLVQQNSILRSIHHYLQSNQVNFGIPYPLSEPKLGAPAPKAGNCGCSEQRKVQAPVLASPPQIQAPVLASQPQIQCLDQGMLQNRQRSPRESPAVEELVEEVKDIEEEEKEEIEKIEEAVEKIEEIQKEENVEETSEKPKRESRLNVNGRKRKRDLKKMIESST